MICCVVRSADGHEKRSRQDARQAGVSSEGEVRSEGSGSGRRESRIALGTIVWGLGGLERKVRMCESDPETEEIRLSHDSENRLTPKRTNEGSL
jgi:hypothetical protein